jgi:uncharacterized protein (DUF1501 family)
MIVPHGERAYYASRPNIAIPRPRSGSSEAAIDLDGSSGLHPALESFERLYRDGLLAPIQAVGSPAQRGRTSTRRIHGVGDAGPEIDAGTAG